MVHRQKLIFGLLTLNLSFFIIFILAFYNTVQGAPLLGIGLPYRIENIIIMTFSVLSVANVVYELIKVDK